MKMKIQSKILESVRVLIADVMGVCDPEQTTHESWCFTLQSMSLDFLGNGRKHCSHDRPNCDNQSNLILID